MWRTSTSSAAWRIMRSSQTSRRRSSTAAALLRSRELSNETAGATACRLANILGQKPFRRYWEGQERLLSFTPPVFYLGQASINEMAKLMSINAGNMIALQFRR
jgi:hypothetical protein